MTKITTDFAGTETLAVTKSRMEEILAWWQYGIGTSATWGDIRSSLNALLGTTAVGSIAVGERASVFRPKINLLNDPNATAVSLLDKYSGSQLFVVDPDTVFTDTAGTTPADFGDGVGGLRVPGGAVIATQATSGSRPKYGRHPAGGIRNLFINSAFAGFGAGAISGSSTGVIQGVEVQRSATTNVPALEIVAVSDETIDIRVHGANTSGATQFYSARVPGGVSDFAAAPGDQIRHSVDLQLLDDSGADTVTSVRVYAPWRDAGGASLGENGFNVVPTSTMTRFSGVGAIVAPANTTQVQDRGIYISVADGLTVDYTIRIRRLQIERGATETTYQRSRAAGFDITEAGQRSVYYLQPDGSDDWMEFAATATLNYPYTLAAAHNLYPDGGTTFSATAGTIFGSITAANARFFRGSNARLNVITSFGNQRSIQTANIAGRVVDIARLPAEGGTGAYWRNGLAFISAPAVDGEVEPLTLNTLFRSTSNYADGRFYAGALVPAAITEAERLALQRYLAGRSGVTLV